MPIPILFRCSSQIAEQNLSDIKCLRHCWFFGRRLKWSKSVTWEVNLSDQEGVRSCPSYSTCFITSTVVPASPKCESSFSYRPSAKSRSRRRKTAIVPGPLIAAGRRRRRQPSGSRAYNPVAWPEASPARAPRSIRASHGPTPDEAVRARRTDRPMHDRTHTSKRMIGETPPEFRSTDRDPRIDVCRGIALWWIFLDHIPNNVGSWLTLRSYGFAMPPKYSCSSRA